MPTSAKEGGNDSQQAAYCGNCHSDDEVGQLSRHSVEARIDACKACINRGEALVESGFEAIESCVEPRNGLADVANHFRMPLDPALEKRDASVKPDPSSQSLQLVLNWQGLVKK